MGSKANNSKQQIKSISNEINKQMKIEALKSLKSFELGGSDYRTIKSQMLQTKTKT
ncbi:hypothetical protein [Arcobacter sp. FWKO B]|uniref:hypothetical protein n=1 Tax=Arcobacter sp. FWKO B TaxID=2593672 RepID=UPI001907DAD6|nr:hypothetical protein [Arcobacter sp. FWKO B]